MVTITESWSAFLGGPVSLAEHGWCAARSARRRRAGVIGFMSGLCSSLWGRGDPSAKMVEHTWRLRQSRNDVAIPKGLGFLVPIAIRYSP